MALWTLSQERTFIVWVVHISKVVILQRTEFAEPLLLCFNHAPSFQLGNVVTHRLGRCVDFLTDLVLGYIWAGIEKVDDSFLSPVQPVGMGVFSKREAGIPCVELFQRALPDRSKETLPLQHMEMIGTLSITYLYGIFDFGEGRPWMIMHILKDASSDVLLLDVFLDVFFCESRIERNYKQRKKSESANIGGRE